MGTGSHHDERPLALWAIDRTPAQPRQNERREAETELAAATHLPGASERPTEQWSRRVADDAAAGTLVDAHAYASDLWPSDFIAAVNVVLDVYERDVLRKSPTDEEAIWCAVERAVRALNVVNAQYSRIETGEREELAEYLSAILASANVDVDALAAGRGLPPDELTDTWRDW